MKLSPDQMDNLIYFLLYCAALAILSLTATALTSFSQFLTARKMLRIKRLSVHSMNTKLDN